MPDTPPDRASGGIPHSFRLRMAWRWVPRMPQELRRRKAFLYALQTIASLADAHGRTRFSDTGQPIRITQLATSMGSREKDARRYLSAAIAAGILTTEQTPRRGRITVYRLVVPFDIPRWDAALAVLDAGADEPQADTEHGHGAAEFGRRAPEPAAAAQHLSSGHDRPTSTPVEAEGVRAADARPGSGPRRPFGSGDVPPNNTGVLKTNPQEMVAVGPQPDVARGHEADERVDDPSPPHAPPPLHAVPGHGPAQTSRRRNAVPDGQMPLLASVPHPPHPAKHPSGPEQTQASIGAPREGWRAVVARERPEDAARVYGDRWTGDHARYLPDPTGT